MALSPDPLDNRVDIGPNNEFLEFLEELRHFDDPLAIIIMCEEIDEERGSPRGYTLEAYLFAMTNTR